MTALQLSPDGGFDSDAYLCPICGESEQWGHLRAVLRGCLPEPNVPKADLCAIKALQLSPDGHLAIAEDNRGNVRDIATDTGTASWEARITARTSAGDP